MESWPIHLITPNPIPPFWPVHGLSGQCRSNLPALVIDDARSVLGTARRLGVRVQIDSDWIAWKTIPRRDAE